MWKLCHTFFQDHLMNKKLTERTKHQFELIFCNIIHVFIVTLDPFNVSLLRKKFFCTVVFAFMHLRDNFIQSDLH